MPLMSQQKERKVDGIRDGLQAGCVGMQMIAAVECGEIACWMSRVMCGGVLIDDRVTPAAMASDERVDLFARYFTLLGPISRPLVRRKG